MVPPNAPMPFHSPSSSGAGSPPPLRAGPAAGSDAPLFRLVNALGFEIALTDACADGRGALVAFVGRGGDGKRQTTLASLEAAAGRLRAQGVTLLAVAVAPPSVSLALTTGARLTFDVLCDQDGLVHHGYRLDVDGAPDDVTLFAIDRDVKIRLGSTASVGDELPARTLELLAESLGPAATS